MKWKLDNAQQLSSGVLLRRSPIAVTFIHTEMHSKVVFSACLLVAYLAGETHSKSALPETPDSQDLGDDILVNKEWVGSQLLPKPQVDGKIVGGSPAQIKDYPYQLSLRYNNRHICGASMISENYVITAAHCVESQKFPSRLSLKSGTSSLYAGGAKHRVESILVHPNYTSFSEDFDAAILKVKEPFKMTDRSMSIVLPKAGAEIEAGTYAVVTGWGVTREGALSPALQLQYVRVPIVDAAECSVSYMGFGEITERMLCAGFTAGKKDACQGDSGGPLVADGVLVGVVSWGAGCARPGLPGVYTNLADPGLRAWISKNTGGL